MPQPSTKTLEIQAGLNVEKCQYCELIEAGSGLLSEWCIKLAETATSIAWLHKDQYWPGRCVVAARQHATELFLLGPDVCQIHLREMVSLAEAIQRAFGGDKMNYECLGNVVQHVHWHLIPRYKWDFLWRRTVWEEPHEPELLGDREYQERVERILVHLKW
jgi:diadenosine tetraphosphate (Ap4A) HIT family hydrolase